MIRHFCKITVVVLTILFFKCGLLAAINIGVSPDAWDAGTGASGEYTSPQFTLNNTGEQVRVNVKATNSASWYLSNMPRLNAFALKWVSGGDSGNVSTNDTLLFSNVGAGASQNFSLTYYSPTYNIPNVSASQVSSITLTAVSSYMGKAWDIKDASIIGPGSSASVALDAAGYPHMTYVDPYTNYLMYSDWNGTPVVISTSNIYGRPDLIVDSNGRPHVVYISNSYDSANGQYYGRLNYSSRVDNVWHTKTITASFNSGSVDLEYSFALDLDNSPHIVYLSMAAAPVYVYLNISEWVEETIQVDSQNFSNWLFLKIGTSGKPHIVFRGYNTRVGDWTDYYATKESGLWIVSDVVAAGPSNLVLDAQGRPVMLLSGESMPLAFYRLADDGTWKVVCPFPDVNWNGGMGLRLDPNGYPSFAYYSQDDSSRALRYAQWTGVEWLVSDIVSSLPETTQDLVVALGTDLANNPVVGYAPPSFSQDYPGNFSYATLK